MENRALFEAWACAWKYFVFHVDQRTKFFQLYLILATSLLTVSALLAALSNMLTLHGAASIIPFSLVFLSFIFRTVDLRLRKSVARAKDSLAFLAKLPENLSQSEEARVLKLFAGEASAHPGRADQVAMPFLGAEAGLSDVYDVTFMVYSLIGLGLGIFLCR